MPPFSCILLNFSSASHRPDSADTCTKHKHYHPPCSYGRNGKLLSRLARAALVDDNAINRCIITQTAIGKGKGRGGNGLASYVCSRRLYHTYLRIYKYFTDSYLSGILILYITKIGIV